MNPVGVVIACALVALGAAVAPDNTYGEQPYENDQQYRNGLYFDPKNMKYPAGNDANSYSNIGYGNKNNKNKNYYDFKNSEAYDDFYAKVDDDGVTSNSDNGNYNNNNNYNNNLRANDKNNKNKYNSNYFTRLNKQYLSPSVNYAGENIQNPFRNYQYVSDVQTSSGYNPDSNSYETPQIEEP